MHIWKYISTYNICRWFYIFLEKINFNQENTRHIYIFSWFTSLKQNLSKIEVSGTGVLKESTVAVCGIKYIDLTKKYLKILAILFI